MWRSTAQILLSFVAAGVAVWFSPKLLEPIGLGEFTFVGQVCAAVVALTALEAAFRRLPESREPPGH